MAKMTTDEWRAFLRDPARPAMLATVRPDGRPHLAPIWIFLDDDDSIVFNTGAETVKGRAILADPRVAICVDDDQAPFAFVLVEGRATVSTDPGELLEWSTRIAGRYMGEERAAEYGRRNGVEGELLVRVIPTHVIAQKGVSD